MESATNSRVYTHESKLTLESCRNRKHTHFSPARDFVRNTTCEFSHILTQELCSQAIVVHAPRRVHSKQLIQQGIIDAYYFDRAIRQVSDTLGHDRPLLIVTDDAQWCQEQFCFPRERSTILEISDEAKALFVMSHFHHFVTSNSDLSWWVAAFSEHKTVAYPKFNDQSESSAAVPSFHRPDWLGVSATSTFHSLTPSPVTVISAFYPVTQAQNQANSYDAWIESFCQVDANMVIYTSAEYAPSFRARRNMNKTVIVEREFKELSLTQEPWRQIWNNTHAIDPERSRRNPDMYAVHAMKQEFAHETSLSNPFDSKWFVWMDVETVCDETMRAQVMHPFSKVGEIALAGHITVLEACRISQTYVEVFRNPEAFPPSGVYNDSLGINILVGDAQAWNQFHLAYRDMVQKKHKMGKFVGKEHHLFMSLLLHRKAPFQLIFSSSENGWNSWLSFYGILGGVL